MERGKKIIVDNGVRAKLLIYGSYPTIREALKGKIDTPRALKIREEAIKLGGVEVEIINENNTGSESPSCSHE
jgi:hypothetical protein